MLDFIDSKEYAVRLHMFYYRFSPATNIALSTCKMYKTDSVLLYIAINAIRHDIFKLGTICTLVSSNMILAEHY